MSWRKVSDALLNQYKKSNKNNRPFIVGVDGLGGAGKTTIVEKLNIDLQDKGYEVVTIHLDDHIVESSKRYETGYEEWYEYYYLQWDTEWLEKQLFQGLYNGKKFINLPMYDKETDTVARKEIDVAPHSIVLIEGIFIQRREWRSYLDFVVFIACPHAKRSKRVLNRDLYIGDYQKRLDKYERRYWVAEEKYIEMEDPVGKADVVYNSSNAG